MPTYVIYYTQGNTPGPFDIYLSGSSGLTLYASNVPQYELVNGYTITFPNGIPSSSVNVFDVSFGCFTDENVPWPSVSPSVTPSITITPSRTPSITVSPSITPSMTVTPSVTPTITPPPSPSPTSTPSVTPSQSPGASPSPTPTPTPSRTPSASPNPCYFYMGTCDSSFTQGWLACAATSATCAGYATKVFPPAVGATLYYAGCITPVTGLNGVYFKVYYLGSGPAFVFNINGLGTIQSLYSCS